MDEPAVQASRMTALLRELVEIESPSHNKEAVDRLGRAIADQCRRLGAQVVVHPCQEAGDLVEARFLPRGPGSTRETKTAILLLCHMDTVFPLGTLSRMPFREEGDRIYGPGVSDMKGGIVVALAALEALQAGSGLGRPVTALFTSDEEIGSRASRSLIEDLARRSELVLVLEPGLPDGSLKTWRKGVGEYHVVARGRAAHAGGDHANGRNAIEELAHQVIAIQKMTDYTRGTTLNAGVVRGGIASNVVPDEASLEVDLRVMDPAEAERISACMQALRPVLSGTSLEISGGLNRPPMPLTPANQEAFERVKRIGARLGMELAASGTGGASDANFVAPLGIPVLDGMGPAGGDYHSEREYIHTESLPGRARLLAAILQEW